MPKLSVHTVAAFFIVAILGSAQAADYPAKLIRVVVPFGAGGASDINTRLISDKLAEQLKQTIVIENRTGASGLVGVGYVVKSAPDGYTLLSATPGSYASAFVKDIQFDVMKDLDPVGMSYRGALVIWVNPSLQVGTLKELVEYAKAHPGKISYGFPGLTGRLAMEVLKSSTETDMVAIPYKSASQIMNGLLSGDSPLAIDSPLIYRAYQQSGKVIALAVADSQRLSILPTVPTTAEVGFPQVQAYYHSGFLAPAGTPPAIQTMLNKALVAVMARPDIQERIRAGGYEPMSTTPERMRELIAQEIDYFSRAAKASNYRPE